MQRTETAEYVEYAEGTLTYRVNKTLPPTFQITGTFGVDGISSIASWQALDAAIVARGTIKG